jgi:hypothetical protein
MNEWTTYGFSPEKVTYTFRTLLMRDDDLADYNIETAQNIIKILKNKTITDDVLIMAWWLYYDKNSFPQEIDIQAMRANLRRPQGGSNSLVFSSQKSCDVVQYDSGKPCWKPADALWPLAISLAGHIELFTYQWECKDHSLA